MRDPSRAPDGQSAAIPSTERCLEFINKAGLPACWATALPVLMKPLTSTLVQATLADMPPNSTPGADGVPASLCIHFVRHGTPKMTEILQLVFWGGNYHNSGFWG